MVQTRKTVGFLTASCMLQGSDDERDDSYEHTLEMGLLRPACKAVNVELVEVVWNDPRTDLEAFDAFVVGTTWDYQEQPENYLQRLAQIEGVRPLFNPLSVIRWNLDKRYLVDLQQKGVPVVPTLWFDRADARAVEEGFATFGTDRVVVKSQVGACAYRQALVRRGDSLPEAEDLPPAGAMVQPFLPSAETEGEYSFLFFDREFSHCARKVPREGDYRVQSVFGGIEHTYQPSSDQVGVAQRVLDAVEGPLLYARVDLMRLPDGRLAVIELELIEPYLYPEQGPKMGRRFAHALGRYLSSSFQ